MRRYTTKRRAFWIVMAAMAIAGGATVGFIRLHWLRVSPPPVPVPPEKRVSLAAVGDVLLGRGIARKIREFGPEYPFEYVKKTISSADIAILNLEGPLTKRGDAQTKAYTFRADPSLTSLLKDAGFDIVNVANNHIFDYGRKGVVDTAQSVEKSGLLVVGAGKNREEAYKARIIERNGVRVGFIAYTDFPGSGLGDNPIDKPTVTAAAFDDLPEQVREAKAQCDVLVVSFHWGIEYQRNPNVRQVSFAHLAIDNGADLVLGHHPHVLQTVEIYKNKPIVYSMGGLLWDGRRSEARRSAIYIFDLGRSSARLVKTLPIKMAGYRPYPVFAKMPKANRQAATAAK